MNRTFVLGDIHGAHKALLQCFDRCAFDLEKDHLICLGDVTDGWPETRACIDELLKVKNLVYLLGNHDFWAMAWMTTGYAEDIWLQQGGEATVKSYQEGVPRSHVLFLESAKPYYVLNNRLFVHAGIDPQLKIEQQDLHTFIWDRNLARAALDLYVKDIQGKITSYEEVYVGHTPIPFGKPIQSCEIWLMDTGAGWSGTLSMMDIHSKEVFMSDPVPSLYPDVEGRKRK
ncbi:MAG: metallophosphoesterase [Bacteroidota bacterium]